MNPNYGREKRISNFNANTMCNSQFPFECQIQIINYQGNFPFNVLFKTSKALKILQFRFSKFCNRSKNKKLERKQMVHFPRRTLMTKKRKSNHQYQTINKNPNQNFQ